jgi:Glycosyl transferase 4-like domain
MAKLDGPVVLLISYHFYPSNEIGGRRTTALARCLASKGVRVIVVSAFGGATIVPGSEVITGVIAAPVKQPRKMLIDFMVSRKRRAAQTSPEDGVGGTVHHTRPTSVLWRMQSGIRRIFFQIAYFVDEHKHWGWRAAREAVRVGKKFDARLVISSSPPFTALLTGRWVASRLGIPHVADLRDPWTDAFAVGRPSRRFELQLLRSLEGWALRSAAAITSTTSTVAELLAARYPSVLRKLHVVRNGYEGDVPTANTDTGGRLAILFAGELYLGRNPFPFLATLEALLARPDVDPARISVTFMGNVALYNGQSLASWIDGRRCAAVVKILPQSPQIEVIKAVAASTLLLNLSQEQQLSIPAKTFEHLACAREILLLCENDSETASLVVGVPGVNQVDQRDINTLEKVLLDIYRRHVVQSRMTVPTKNDVTKFSRAVANERFWKVITSVANLHD